MCVCEGLAHVGSECEPITIVNTTIPLVIPLSAEGEQPLCKDSQMDELSSFMFINPDIFLCLTKFRKKIPQAVALSVPLFLLILFRSNHSSSPGFTVNISMYHCHISPFIFYRWSSCRALFTHSHTHAEPRVHRGPHTHICTCCASLCDIVFWNTFIMCRQNNIKWT